MLQEARAAFSLQELVEYLITWSLELFRIVSQQELPLKAEYDYYMKEKATLVPKYEGKFVIIKDEEVIGPFDTDADAYQAALLKFGIVPFLITPVLSEDEKSVIPILELGLLDAGL